MQDLAETLRILADGEFHSGEQLAKQLNVSRGTVWKHIEDVRQVGVDVYAIRGKGYRLAQPFQPLDTEAILKTINQNSSQPFTELELYWSLESTNAHLMGQAKQGIDSGQTCIAEMQTKGRGRRGRAWQSPLGGNIYLSQYWQLTEGVRSAGLLSLAAAVAVIRALHAVGVNGVGVKWPNDIVYEGKKLAGILLEVSGEPSGPCHVIIGLGLNIALSDASAEQIDQPWTDLSTIMPQAIDRNKLVGLLVKELLKIGRNIDHGLEQPNLNDYLAEWQAVDNYRGRSVLLRTAKGDYKGIAQGVDESGALQLAIDNKVMSFHSGEVSLRLA